MNRASVIAYAAAGVFSAICWLALVFGPPWAKLAALTIGVPAGIAATPRAGR